jgi:hypothetical protein
MFVDSRPTSGSLAQTPTPKKRVRMSGYELEGDNDNSLYSLSSTRATPSKKDTTSRRFLSVGIRLRPENSSEMTDKHFLSCVRVIEGEEPSEGTMKGEVEMQRSYQDTRRYAFDHVFGPKSDNR